MGNSHGGELNRRRIGGMRKRECWSILLHCMPSTTVVKPYGIRYVSDLQRPQFLLTSSLFLSPLLLPLLPLQACDCQLAGRDDCATWRAGLLPRLPCGSGEGEGGGTDEGKAQYCVW